MIENMKPSFISDPPLHGAERSNKVTVVSANTGEAYWVMGTLFTYLVTGAGSGGSYFTLIVDVGPEQGPPPHIHHLEEEQFYVLDGQLTYSIGDQTHHVSAGDFTHIPRGTVHTFRNGSKPSRLLATFGPAGMEGFFREVGELRSYLITAKIIARCSDGSLLQGTLQDTSVIFPPGAPVPGEVFSDFNGELINPQ
jgi:quercetin dioxygenase-like cupin family protein